MAVAKDVSKEVTKEDKQKALEAAIKQIERDFGQGAVMKLGDSARNKAIEVIPTGSLSLDYALGVGGVPKGRITEVYGPESSDDTGTACRGRGAEDGRRGRLH